MKCKSVFKALALNKAIDVYLYIFQGCQTEEYKSFESIGKDLKIGKYRLRYITNVFSHLGLIKSIRDTRYEDKRKKVYVVCDVEFANKVLDFLQFLEA